MLAVVQTANADVASKGYVDDIVGAISTDVSASVSGTGNVITNVGADGDTITATKGITAEETKNKVTTIRDTATATDTAYPSEKAVATALEGKQDKLDGEVLTNTATGTGSLSTGGAEATAASSAIAIGTDATASGNNSVAVGNISSASGNYSVALGNVAMGTKEYGTAVGAFAYAMGDNSSALGGNAHAYANNSSAFGAGAVANSEYSIQLGRGTNSEANTLSVGLSDNKNYKLLGSDGKIPSERMPNTIPVGSVTATTYATMWVE